MIKVRGYIFSRSFMGERVPQNIQNLVIRDYCEKNNLFYNLSASEYSMPNCHKILDQIIEELKNLDGIVAYSLFQLPIDNKKRYAALSQIIKKNKKFYFAIENMKLTNQEDLEVIENIWLLKKTLPNCLKKI
ncbi:MAG: sporadic carbohydrate cluster protein, LIC12192 family [Pelagibacterales bacterium]|nr:sporadic carbohydrate cluster protein, LIC12192 family [Pelagibacterales bacterium]